MPLAAALTAACALPASNLAGSSLEACTSTETPPEQQLFPRSRQLARQRAFEARTRPGQPTLRELLAAASDFGVRPGQPAPVTAVLNVWNRRTLCRQLEALLAQTAPPALIWVCAFGPTPLAAALGAIVSRYNDSRIVLLQSEANLKYYGRFQAALAAPTRFVAVIDDDMVPGRRHLEALLHVAMLRPPLGARRLLGSIGWLLPPPQPGLVFRSYRATENSSGGLYVPDLAYGLAVERLLEVDYLCSAWFGETEWVKLLFREAPITHATGEDFHLSHMLRKYAGVRSYVLPAGDPSFGGDTDHRLAYSRYSTGGAPTIALRDRIWWGALRQGASFQWGEAAPLRKPLE
eukprot:CAMPEP_0185425112 /NCGR_PEP_ID=MMETSP1365-20130426/13718_1 /TAXON_ID=38817 /ORGANISM="Gephyrocapsa oceanica, Strain RCC1303" /LENGTH=347 /DNA_ID=CAMNT_0028029079 /DNA_START=75 /DNA_END=1115 /DNA_ORIENTATION=-